MSILDTPNDRSPSVQDADRAAQRLKNLTINTYHQMVQAFNQGAITFWKNPSGATPEQIAAVLGTDAKEIFELHAKLGALLASVKPESVQKGTDVVGQFTINNDGTVTINQ